MESEPMPSRPSRRYDGSRRQAEADERKRRVVEAATRLFLEQGYGATSIKAVAEEAGVSAPTVYAQFESKAGILARVVDVAVAGDHDDAGLARDRPEFDVIYRPSVGARQRIRIAATATAQRNARSAPLLALVDSVAGTDAAVRDLAARLAAGALEDATVAAGLFPPEELRPDLDRQAVARILYTLAGPQVFTLLTTKLGLTLDEYADWVAESVTRLLLPDEPGAARG
jgi:AcrR family transcriptional regulator